METRSLYGVHLQVISGLVHCNQRMLSNHKQRRNDVQISPNHTFKSVVTPRDAKLSEDAARDLTVATVSPSMTFESLVDVHYPLISGPVDRHQVHSIEFSMLW